MTQRILEGGTGHEPHGLTYLGWDTSKSGDVTVEVECRDGEVVYIGPPRTKNLSPTKKSEIKKGGVIVTESPCLRPACLGDVTLVDESWEPWAHQDSLAQRFECLKALYDAEWKKRGYKRSP